MIEKELPLLLAGDCDQDYLQGQLEEAADRIREAREIIEFVVKFHSPGFLPPEPNMREMVEKMKVYLKKVSP